MLEKDGWMAKLSRHVIRSLDTVGYPDALEDEEFLRTCFIDSGYVEVLTDTKRPERVVLGRTGAGKSALLERLVKIHGERVRRFLPETLSLQRLSNSRLLNELQELGVNLDLFFSLLWKHIFAVELIRWRYAITDQHAQRTVMQSIVSAINPTQRRALEYLELFGDKFWMESNERVVGFAQHFEDEILKTLQAPDVFAGRALEKDSLLSREDHEKQAARDAAQAVVDSIQRHHLAEIVQLVKAVLRDERTKWYIVIDKLDENWVDDRFKAHLIRALLDAIRDFSAVPNLKIVVCLRYDLIDRVFDTAVGSGAQREKYHGQFLHIRWTRPELTRFLDRRINQRLRSRNKHDTELTHRDVFPREVMGRQATMEWILDRTLLRPRDLIAFMNLCLQNSVNRNVVPAKVILNVESDYSQGRLNAIYAEWDIDYPNLRYFVDFLRRKPAHFSVGDISEEEIMRFAEVELAEHQTRLKASRDLLRVALESFDLSLDAPAFRRLLFWIFYRAGIVGLKVSDATGYAYSYQGQQHVSRSEINDSTRVSVHACFMRALGIGRAHEQDRQSS
jgi:hypothetical protein